MPGRATPLVNGEFYHVYNRGSNKQSIFLKSRDYQRFRQTFYYYQFQGPKPKFANFAKSQLTPFNPKLNIKIVELVCYCLMPNHFHFLIRQLKDSGISTFMGQLTNSYTKYFNIKYGKIGPLFQGRFKSVRVETDEQLLHLSRYIHLNPIVSGLVNNLTDYQWSSLNDYLHSNSGMYSVGYVMEFFRGVNQYRQFVEDQVDYGRSLESIKHLTIDENYDDTSGV